MQSEKLIQLLKEQTRQHVTEVEKLQRCDLHTLTWRESDTSWNTLECLQHLNLYSDFYLPEIEKQIIASHTQHDINFKSGLLGGYFAKSMLPNGKLKKMKTFKSKNPLHKELHITVLDTFIQEQIKLLDLLNQSNHISLNKVKIKTSISSFLKLRLGDTFQFLINHIIRHLRQIERIQSAQQYT